MKRTYELNIHTVCVLCLSFWWSTERNNTAFQRTIAFATLYDYYYDCDGGGGGGCGRSSINFVFW